MKNIQISEELFFALLKYHLVEIDDVLPEIKMELEDKLEAMIRRDSYTKYKTAPTEEEREKARQEYLDVVCMTGAWHAPVNIVKEKAVCGNKYQEPDFSRKPSAFESEIHPSHKSSICTLCISPLQGAKVSVAALTNAVAFVSMPDTAMSS